MTCLQSRAGPALFLNDSTHTSLQCIQSTKYSSVSTTMNRSKLEDQQYYGDLALQLEFTRAQSSTIPRHSPPRRTPTTSNSSNSRRCVAFDDKVEQAASKKRQKLVIYELEKMQVLKNENERLRTQLESSLIKNFKFRQLMKEQQDIALQRNNHLNDLVVQHLVVQHGQGGTRSMAPAASPRLSTSSNLPCDSSSTTTSFQALDHEDHSKRTNIIQE